MTHAALMSTSTWKPADLLAATVDACDGMMRSSAPWIRSTGGRLLGLDTCIGGSRPANPTKALTYLGRNGEPTVLSADLPVSRLTFSSVLKT